MIAEVVERYEIAPKSAVNYLKKNWEIVKELNKPGDAVLNINAIENLEIVEIDRKIFGIALECSKEYGLLSNDAVHLATMKRHGITNIATTDGDFERVEWLNQRDGIAGVVVLVPYFLPFSQADLVTYFSSLAQLSRHPLYIYDLPAVTHLPVEIDTLHQLTEHLGDRLDLVIVKLDRFGQPGQLFDQFPWRGHQPA